MEEIITIDDEMHATTGKGILERWNIGTEWVFSFLYHFPPLFHYSGHHK